MRNNNSNIIHYENEQEPIVTYMARPLVQATLPHRAPSNELPVWSRKNGNLKLVIRAGWDPVNNKSYGYPYGTIPRLLLFWLTTEVVKSNSRKVELGKNLSVFMRDLGLNPSSGTGERSDSKRLRDQMTRLFRATISFELNEIIDNKSHRKWVDMQVAPLGEFWWDTTKPDENVFFNSWIELGETFFNAITQRPVPLDMNALQALRSSPLALDMYAWSTHKIYSLNRSSKASFISWAQLRDQFGTDYSRMTDFKRKAAQALVKVQLVYPALRVTETDTGLLLKPSLTSVSVKKSTRNLVG